MSRHADRAINPLTALTLTNATTFTSNSNWTCPAGVTEVYLTGCGGGGGGRDQTAFTENGGRAAVTYGNISYIVRPQAGLNSPTLILMGQTTTSTAYVVSGLSSTTTPTAISAMGAASSFYYPAGDAANHPQAITNSAYAISGSKVYVISNYYDGSTSAQRIYSSPYAMTSSSFTATGPAASVNTGCLAIVSDGANRVVALNRDGRTTYVSANDGSSWTSTTNAIPSACTSLKYMNSKYIAWSNASNTGSTAVIYESADGISWTSRTIYTSAFWSTSSVGVFLLDVAWTGVRYIVGGYYYDGSAYLTWVGSNTVLTSAFTLTTYASGSGSFNGFVSPDPTGSSGVWLSKATNTTLWFKTTDHGVTWSFADIVFPGTFYQCLIGGNGRLWAMKGTGNAVSVSNDNGVSFVETSNTTLTNGNTNFYRAFYLGDYVVGGYYDSSVGGIAFPVMTPGTVSGSATTFGSLLSIAGGGGANLYARGAGGSSSGMPYLGFAPKPDSSSQQKYPGSPGLTANSSTRGGGGGSSVFGVNGVSITSGTGNGTAAIGYGAGDFNYPGLPGGGGAEGVYRYRVPVVPGNVYAVTIGSGGSATSTGGFLTIEYK